MSIYLNQDLQNSITDGGPFKNFFWHQFENQSLCENIFFFFYLNVHFHANIEIFSKTTLKNTSRGQIENWQIKKHFFYLLTKKILSREKVIVITDVLVQILVFVQFVQKNFESIQIRKISALFSLWTDYMKFRKYELQNNIFSKWKIIVVMHST